MSEHPPGDPPRDDAEPGEFNEFRLGPKDNADGTSPADAEEIRRLKSIEYHLRRRLEELGLDAKAAEHPPEPTTPTTRSRDIRQIADRVMPEADERVRTRIDRAKIESPDGWKASRTQIHLGALDDLSTAVKQLADSATDTLIASIRGSAKVCVRFGRWFKVDATASVGGEAADRDDANS
ncbi:MAG: hypothetical protein ACFCBV_01895 [Phycisphaerales bacterium]